MNKAADPTTAARPVPEAPDPTALPKPLIPEDWLGFVEEMLVAGLAVEDIAEAVAAQSGPEIKVGAMLAHFRTHPELQKRRVEQMVSGVAKLREALGDSEAENPLRPLADSALMVGYMGLNQKSATSLTIKDAEMLRLTGENLKLRKQYMQLKERGQRRENALLQSRLRHEDIKIETARVKLRHLNKTLRTLLEEGKLDQNTLDKIREIYGIVRQPFVEQNSEAPAQA